MIRLLPGIDTGLWLRPPAGVSLLLLGGFAAVGLLCMAYAWAAERRRPAMAVLVHVGGGMLTLLAGDLLTLLIGWELLSFSAFFLLARRGRGPGLRIAPLYLMFQIGAAALLFVAIMIQAQSTGSLDVAELVPDAQPYAAAAVVVKIAVIPLHAWLVLAYTSAPFAVAPLLSLYTTKVGVYSAARLLVIPGLAEVGAVMALAGVIAALAQKSGRRLLAYHIISQVGYMMAGVGLATELGKEAGLYHALNHVIYKSLLFMVMGAVIFRTGRERLDQLGGLARAMPWTFAAGIVGAASISGVPLFNGFASKELLTAATEAGWIKLLLLLASAGTGLSFLKFLNGVFVQPPRAPYLHPILEAPRSLRWPMAVLSALCLAGGLWPSAGLPGLVHDYYRLESVAMAVIPLVGSVVLWRLVGRRLLAATPAPAPGWLGREARKLVGGLRAAIVATHEGPWQAYLMLVFLAWAALAWALLRQVSP